jgi:hypothetical protein
MSDFSEIKLVRRALTGFSTRDSNFPFRDNPGQGRKAPGVLS